MRRSQNVQHKTAQGFTLSEVITVVVILSILAVLGTRFVTESTKSYYATQTRSRLVNTGRQALERMSRQLRGALPYSVRITNVTASASCVEFMPIASGGNYIGAVPDTNNAATASANIVVSPHSIDFGSAQFVSIGAMSPVELYGPTPASRATLSSRTATSLTLALAESWERNSVNQRFYLLDAPQAFCIIGNQLRFYANQSATTASVDTNSAYSIMADNVAATSSFSIGSGSENRAVGVVFTITFSSRTLNGGAESVAFNQSVTIRNVP